jgi:hypothetical protein
VPIDNISIGDHTIVINARDQAGNELEEELELDFEVEERDDFELEVNPGWNLISLPGQPEDPAIGSIFPAGSSVTTVYTFDPTVPGGWLVADRESDEDEWLGDLTEIVGTRGYWLLADQINEVDIQIPRIIGGAAGGGTPVQPPTIDLFPGWNLIPVIDVSGEKEFGDGIDADVYFGGVREQVKQIVGFDTITNKWETVPFFEDILLDNNGDTADPGDPTNAELLDDEDLFLGEALWVFISDAVTFAPR